MANLNGRQLPQVLALQRATVFASFKKEQTTHTPTTHTHIWSQIQAFIQSSLIYRISIFDQTRRAF